MVVLPIYIRSFDFHQKIFTIVMTSSDFADDVITIGVFDGFLGAPGKCSLGPEFLSDEVG